MRASLPVLIGRNIFNLDISTAKQLYTRRYRLRWTCLPACVTYIDDWWQSSRRINCAIVFIEQSNSARVDFYAYFRCVCISERNESDITFTWTFDDIKFVIEFYDCFDQLRSKKFMNVNRKCNYAMSRISYGRVKKLLRGNNYELLVSISSFGANVEKYRKMQLISVIGFGAFLHPSSVNKLIMLTDRQCCCLLFVRLRSRVSRALFYW